jgi:hypothetical protein
VRSFWGGDPHYSNVILHLPLQEHTRDVSPRRCPVTQTGGGVFSGAAYRPPALNDARGSYLYDPTTDYLTVTAPSIGFAPWTIEFWAKSPSSAGTTGINFDCRAGDNDYYGFALYFRSTGKYAIGGDNPFAATESSLSWATDTWYHVVAVQRGSNIFIYINGKLEITRAWSYELQRTSWRIGAQHDAAESSNGALADLRVTKGIARYTADFVPPTSLYPTHGVSILSRFVPLPRNKRPPMLIRRAYRGDQYFDRVDAQLPLRANFIDESRLLTAVTVNGDAKIVNDAAYFDGSGDTLTGIPFSASAAEYFTLELWHKLTTSGDIYQDPFNKYPHGMRYGNAGFGYKLQVSLNFNYAPEICSCAVTQQDNVDKWVHLAFVCGPQGLGLFVGGVQQMLGLGVNPSSYPYLWVGSAVVNLGAFSGTATVAGNSYTGYVRDVRYTRGVARYLTNFTPPPNLPPRGVYSAPRVLAAPEYPPTTLDVITGTCDALESHDTAAVAALLRATGILTATDAVDLGALAGLLAGFVALEGGDVMAASGKLIAAGNLSATTAADLISAVGKLTIRGVLNTTEFDRDELVALGSIVPALYHVVHTSVVLSSPVTTLALSSPESTLGGFPPVVETDTTYDAPATLGVFPPVVVSDITMS